VFNNTGAVTWGLSGQLKLSWGAGGPTQTMTCNSASFTGTPASTASNGGSPLQGSVNLIGLQTAAGACSGMGGVSMSFGGGLLANATAGIYSLNASTHASGLWVNNGAAYSLGSTPASYALTWVNGTSSLNPSTASLASTLVGYTASGLALRVTGTFTAKLTGNLLTLS
jgi:hypothetical protein